MNQNVGGNRKMFWKVVSKVNGGKVESCSRIKDGNGCLALGKDVVQRIWKNFVVDLYNRDTQEEVAFHMYGFVGVHKVNYFGGELK